MTVGVLKVRTGVLLWRVDRILRRPTRHRKRETFIFRSFVLHRPDPLHWLTDRLTDCVHDCQREKGRFINAYLRCLNRTRRNTRHTERKEYIFIISLCLYIDCTTDWLTDWANELLCVVSFVTKWIPLWARSSRRWLALCIRLGMTRRNLKERTFIHIDWGIPTYKPLDDLGCRWRMNGRGLENGRPCCVQVRKGKRKEGGKEEEG